MADVKISGLPASTTPLTGAEVLPIVQGGTTRQVSIDNVTAGRAVSALSLTSTNDASISGLTVGKGAGAISSNTAVGSGVLAANTTATNNTAIGFGAGAATSTGGFNTFAGFQAGAFVVGSRGVYVGYHAGFNCAGSGANYNTAVGVFALFSAAASSGYFNTAVGGFSLNGTTSGNQNAAFGYGAGQFITSGTNNTLLGFSAGNSGTNNLTTGSNNTIIGFNAASSSATVSNEVTIGNSSVTNLRIPGVGFTATTNGFGYATGSGGAVTQTTSRTTGVTLNKTNGAITLVSAAGLATYQSFTVTNSTVAATDTIIVNQKSGTDKYIILVTTVAAGSFQITYATTGGLTTEQPVFNFAVVKAVTA